jgi:tRNA(Ile)-lysidine synthase
MRAGLIEQHVSDIIQKHHLVEKGSTVVVAVSGGADSVCLLKALANLKKEVGINLHAAHLDHGIRGGDSQNDASYVAALCNRLKIPLTIKHENVYTYKKKHRCSLEEAARNVRYAFLADVLQTVNGSCVAVGHTREIGRAHV